MNKSKNIDWLEITTLDRPFGISYLYKPHQAQKVRTYETFAAALQALRMLQKNTLLYANIEISFMDLLEENEYDY